MKTNKIKKSGFTLIEILVVIGIIAILAAIVIIAINPARQFAQARNTQRTSNVNAILNAIGQRSADNKGVFAGAFTIGATTYTCPTITVLKGVDDVAGGTGIDLSCLVPTYISALPTDPAGVTAPDTGYTVEVLSTGRTSVCSPKAALEATLPNPSPICIVR